ncbi:hypothetical protein CEXT_458931 [Caerostris extrusa]|uniref:Uncharacterized protein n=1 Tax=Caerostris extrusa TaxID=172846 RepID=A0AAV4MR03_CAEEX|nr:hypothetical protein CEXT_458931 [Caerostris extrusa]
MTHDDKPLCSSEHNKHLLLQEYLPRLFDGTLKRITSTPKKCHMIKFEYSNGIMSQYKFLFSEQMGLGQLLSLFYLLLCFTASSLTFINPLTSNPSPSLNATVHFLFH